MQGKVSHKARNKYKNFRNFILCISQTALVCFCGVLYHRAQKFSTNFLGKVTHVVQFIEIPYQIIKVTDALEFRIISGYDFKVCEAQ